MTHVYFYKFPYMFLRNKIGATEFTLVLVKIDRSLSRLRFSFLDFTFWRLGHFPYIPSGLVSFGLFAGLKKKSYTFSCVIGWE